MALKLVCLNIERSKHLELVLPFIEREQPDVLCVQELMLHDIPAFEEIAGRNFFAPTTRYEGDDTAGIEGVGLFSRLPMRDARALYYHGAGLPDALFIDGTPKEQYATESNAVALATFEKAGVMYAIGTTHFTWTPDGSANDEQRKNMRALLRSLEGLRLVLCGDFNAPRGGEIFAMLASRYKDEVPQHYKTSVDIDIHRAGKDRPHELADKMVDGLFTTPEYRCESVALVNGLSDHMAIVASIVKEAGPA